MATFVRGNMKAERARSGLSVAEVARIVGVHPNMVVRWENAEAEPMASNLIKLMKLYECDAEYLLEITEINATRRSRDEDGHAQ